MGRPQVAVIGGGAWGLALAAAAARTGPTVVYSRRAASGGAKLPEGASAVGSLAELARASRLIILAVPSEVARSVLRELGEHVDGRHLLVHGIRGLAGADLERISEIARDECAARRLGALGGPALAADIAAGKPSLLVAGAAFPEVTQAVSDALGGEFLRVYCTHDLIGLEWASALVGCLAIGVGYAQGVGMSAGLMAGFISRSIAEGAKIAAAAGGDERTMLGLAGNGNLLACAGQPDRPEVLLGGALARGKPLEEARALVGQRVEAVDLIPRVTAWADARRVSSPIFHALAEGVLASRPAAEMVRTLMTSPIEDRG